MSKLIDWLNSNKNRAYPFEEDSNGYGAGQDLPNWCILDFCMIDSRDLAETDDNDVYLVSMDVNTVTTTNVSYQLTFRTRGTTYYERLVHGDTEDFSITLNFTRSSEVVKDTISIVTTIAGINSVHEAYLPYVRVVACMDWEKINAFPTNAHIDFVRPKKIIPTRIIHTNTPAVHCLEGLTGDIHLTDGINTKLSVTGNMIRLSVRRGTGIPAPCPTSFASCDGRLLFINGQSADQNGNICIVGGGGVSVSSGTYDQTPSIEISPNSELKRLYGK